MCHRHIKIIEFTALGMSLTEMRNRKGLRTERCGTPHKFLPYLESRFSMSTKQHSLRKILLKPYKASLRENLSL